METMTNKAYDTRPNLEQAEFLFKRFPNKPLREWAEDWGVSHEQVRLMKIKLGIPTSRKVEYSPSVVENVINYVKEGRGTINTPRTYATEPFGKSTFFKWMTEYPELYQKVKEAEKFARHQKENPTHKVCSATGKLLPISEFYKDSNTLDGYSSRCKDAVKANAKKYYAERYVEEPTVNAKVCPSVPELGPLPIDYFGFSKKHATGLQTYCKFFQKEYQKALQSDSIDGQDEAYNQARLLTLDYFASEGIFPLS